jgi:hypothetical protein
VAPDGKALNEFDVVAINRYRLFHFEIKRVRRKTDLKGVIIRSRGATVVFVDKSTEEWLADHGALLGRCSRYGL